MRSILWDTSAVLMLLAASILPSVSAAVTNGPLRVHPTNPTCIVDALGTTVTVTGTHTWNSLQDRDGNPTFDYARYLTLLESSNHNYQRMWIFQWKTWHPEPWVMVGDKADLTKFNQAFFDRLRERIVAARAKGIYVQICLFWGHCSFCNRWDLDYFNPSNNINGISCDGGYQSQNLSYPAITAAQEAYVKKVIDAVNEYDNVAYEIANEADAGSAAWQTHMVDIIHDYEKTKKYQHPVVMSALQDGAQNAIFTGPSDFGIPLGVGNEEAPSRYPTNKPLIWDSDHVTFGNFQNNGQPWKAFTRALFPIQMDQPGNAIVNGNYSQRETDRALGDIRTVASKVDRGKMTIQLALSSTRFCIAEPGRQYVIYQVPGGAAFTVDLSAGSGSSFNVEWLNVQTHVFQTSAKVTGGSATQSFTPPFGATDAVLILTAQGTSVHSDARGTPSRNQAATGFSAVAQGRGISVRAPRAETVGIYSAQGLLIRQDNLLAGTAALSLPAPGLYIVRFGLGSATEVRTAIAR